MKKFALIIVVAALCALAFGSVGSALAAPAAGSPSIVQAQGEEPTTPAPADLNAEFLFFLVTITGFIKARFNISGNYVLGIAFVVGLVLYFAPLLAPLAGPIIGQFVEFIKWFIAGAGSFDTGVNLISTAQKEAQRESVK